MAGSSSLYGVLASFLFMFHRISHGVKYQYATADVVMITPTPLLLPKCRVLGAFLRRPLHYKQRLVAHSLTTINRLTNVPVKQKMAKRFSLKCSGCKELNDRPAQRHCTECHRTYMKIWRANKKAKHSQFMKSLAQAANIATEICDIIKP